MCRSHLAAIGLAMALLGGCSSQKPRSTSPEAEQLQGTWEVTSARRDGEPDPARIGACLTFAGAKVTFQPKLETVHDATLGRMALD
jgi:hypothetical protein